MLDESSYLDPIDADVHAPAAPAADDAGWESSEPTNQPDASTSASADDGAGDSEETPTGEIDAEDEGWEDGEKPAADPDDVAPEDRDPKGKVPSWRVREIKAQKDKEIEQLRAENEAAKAELARVRTGAPVKPEAQIRTGDVDADRERVITAITAQDPVIVECDKKLEAIQYLVEHAPEELPKYFRNADHMAAEVAKLTATRSSQLNQRLTSIEQEHAQAQATSARQQSEYVSKLVTDYDTAIKSSDIPNITKYAQRLATNAQRLHPEIRHIVLSAPDKDVITAAIGSNRAVFDELAAVDPSKPMTPQQLAAVGLRIGKAVAAYANKPKGSYVDETPAAPAKAAVQPTATRRSARSPAHVPKYRTERDGTIVM